MLTAYSVSYGLLFVLNTSSFYLNAEAEGKVRAHTKTTGTHLHTWVKRDDMEKSFLSQKTT